MVCFSNSEHFRHEISGRNKEYITKRRFYYQLREYLGTTHFHRVPSRYRVVVFPMRLLTAFPAGYPVNCFDAESHFDKVQNGTDACDLPFRREYICELVGFGAIATRNIRKREIVCEYFGSEMDEAQLEEKEAEHGESGKPKGSYELKGVLDASTGKRRDVVWDCYTSADGRTLDITDNPGVWLNSVDVSRSSSYASAPDQNCRLRYLIHNGRVRLFIYAICDICVNDELIHDYCNREMLQC